MTTTSPTLDPRVLDVATGGRYSSGSSGPERETALLDWARIVAHEAQESVLLNMGPVNHEVLGPLVIRAVEQQSIGLAKYLAGDVTALRLSRDNRAVIAQIVRDDLDTFPRIISGIRLVEHTWRRVFVHLVLDSFPPTECATLLDQVDSELSRYFDRQIDAMTELHADETARAFERQAATRRQLIDRLLAGERLPDDVIQNKIGVDLGHDHLGIVVASASGVLGCGAVVDLAALNILSARLVPTGSPLIVAAGDREIWLWLSAPSLDEAAIADALAEFGADHLSVVIAFGAPRSGLEGFRRSHLQARAALAFARLAAEPGRVWPYRDHALDCMLTADPSQARWFVEDELGPLLGGDAGLRELRATLLGMTERGGNIAETASALFVHRNTVTYRLKRIAEILGRDPLDRPFETYAALTLARAFGGDGVGTAEATTQMGK
jgi:hypothetical protein